MAGPDDPKGACVLGSGTFTAREPNDWTIGGFTVGMPFVLLLTSDSLSYMPRHIVACKGVLLFALTMPRGRVHGTVLVVDMRLHHPIA